MMVAFVVLGNAGDASVITVIFLLFLRLVLPFPALGGVTRAGARRTVGEGGDVLTALGRAFPQAEVGEMGRGRGMGPGLAAVVLSRATRERSGQSPPPAAWFGGDHGLAGPREGSVGPNESERGRWGAAGSVRGLREWATRIGCETGWVGMRLNRSADEKGWVMFISIEGSVAPSHTFMFASGVDMVGIHVLSTSEAERMCAGVDLGRSGGAKNEGERKDEDMASSAPVGEIAPSPAGKTPATVAMRLLMLCAFFRF
jgi:hypothetical protein